MRQREPSEGHDDLREPEIGEFDRIVTIWLDFAKDQVRRLSRSQVEVHAESKCEQFSVQRRALLEAEGADFNVRALETSSTALAKPKMKR